MAKLRTNTRLWVYAFLLLLAIAMLLYLRRQVKTSKEAASLPFIERDYPEIRKEGTLRLLAGYGSGGEVQGGQLTGAIYELAKQLEKKSRADSAHHISRQVELAGHSITLPKASPLSLFIEHLGEEIGDSLSIQVDTLYAAEQLAMQVASGKINYTACTSEEAERFARLFPALDCTLPLSYSVRTAWLMRRNSPALRDSLIAWGVGR